MKIHELKTHPIYFKHILDGTKNFEVRFNDRDFQVGDRLDLIEYNPESQEYTGVHCHRFVSYILKGGNFGIHTDYCVLSLSIDPVI